LEAGRPDKDRHPDYLVETGYSGTAAAAGRFLIVYIRSPIQRFP
jgi:hypothetical protein